MTSLRFGGDSEIVQEAGMTLCPAGEATEGSTRASRDREADPSPHSSSSALRWIPNGTGRDTPRGEGNAALGRGGGGRGQVCRCARTGKGTHPRSGVTRWEGVGT